MHVLQINNNHRIIGGSDRVYFNTGTLLEQAGHQVSHFAARSAQDQPSPDAAHFCDGVDTARAGARDLLRFLHNRGAARALDGLLGAKAPFDLAHLHIYYGRLTPAILAPLRRRGLPIVQSLHEYKLACPVYTLHRDGALCEACITGPALNCLRHRCKDGSVAKSTALWLDYTLSRLQGDVRLIDRFLCVSDFQRQMMIRAGLPPERLLTLHNFIDAAAVQPDIPAPTEDYLLYFGRIETLKGLPTLLEAAAQTGTKLKIAGTGSWDAALHARAAGMPNVDCLGFVTGAPLRRLIARARAVVVPSEWYETFGLTALEAKAVGTPVIAARIGGLAEVVRDGVDGFLFEPGNVAALAAAIGALDHADLDAMGRAGEQDVAARFSAPAHLARLLEVYADVIAEAAGR